MHKLLTAKESDLPAIEKLFRRVDAGLLAEGNDMWDKGYPDKRDFENDIKNKRLYCLKEGSRVLACAAVSHNVTEDFFSISKSQEKTEEILSIIGWDGEPITILHRFMVDPTYWGKGVGRELLLFIESLYKGSTWVFAAFLGNAKALRFYSKNGFTVQGIYDRFEWGDASTQYLIYKKYKKNGLCAL